MLMKKRLFLLALPICFASFIACNKSPDAKKDPATAAAPANPADPKVSEQDQNVPENLNKIWYYANPDVKSLNYSILIFKSGQDDQGNAILAMHQINYGAYSTNLADQESKHPSQKLNLVTRGEKKNIYAITVDGCGADKSTYGVLGEIVPQSTGNKGLAPAEAAVTSQSAAAADAANGNASTPATTQVPTASAQKHQLLPHKDACTAAAISFSTDNKLNLRDPKNDQMTYQYSPVDKSKLADLQKQVQQEVSFSAPSPDALKTQLQKITLFVQSKTLYTYTNNDGKLDMTVADQKPDASLENNIQLQSLTWDSDITKVKVNGVNDDTMAMTAAKSPDIGTLVEVTYQTSDNSTKSLVKAKLFRIKDKVYVLRKDNRDQNGLGTIEDTILGLTKDAPAATTPPAPGSNS